MDYFVVLYHEVQCGLELPTVASGCLINKEFRR